MWGEGITLSSEDLRAASIATQDLCQQAWTRRRIFLDELQSSCDRCYHHVAEKKLEGYYEKYGKGVGNVVNPSPLIPNHSELESSGDFCKECLEYAVSYDYGRHSVWDELPCIFLLPPWDELRNEL